MVQPGNKSKNRKAVVDFKIYALMLIVVERPVYCDTPCETNNTIIKILSES